MLYVGWLDQTKHILIIHCATPTPVWRVMGNKKKVWSCLFICVEALECPETNKQYPTLVSIYQNDI